MPVKAILTLAISLLLGPFFGTGAVVSAQTRFTLETMPRIDVHAHIGDMELMKDYVQTADTLRDRYGINLSTWIDLRAPLAPDSGGARFISEVSEAFPGRFLFAINDYEISDGLRYSPEEIAEWAALGVSGYKIWVGVSSLVDDPANDPTFTKMAQLGLPGASIHISQPYPTEWCEDPVAFWEAHNAWERVLDRHPQMIVVNAHMLDHFYSDEQLDYLKYVLETYPNVNIDLAARFQQFHLLDREKLRAFIIEYADRILFGTDISGQPEGGNHAGTAAKYFRAFQLLESDSVVNGGFFGNTPTQGLALPQDVLEKIYFRNAIRIYPGAVEALRSQGFEIQ
ncbi:amidohydrolase family protein [Gemmatimonadota bacterium]